MLRKSLSLAIICSLRPTVSRTLGERGSDFLVAGRTLHSSHCAVTPPLPPIAGPSIVSAGRGWAVSLLLPLGSTEPSMVSGCRRYSIKTSEMHELFREKGRDMETCLQSLKGLNGLSEETDTPGSFAVSSMSPRALARSCASLGKVPWGEPEGFSHSLSTRVCSASICYLF